MIWLVLWLYERWPIWDSIASYISTWLYNSVDLHQGIQTNGDCFFSMREQNPPNPGTIASIANCRKAEHPRNSHEPGPTMQGWPAQYRSLGLSLDTTSCMRFWKWDNAERFAGSLLLGKRKPRRRTTQLVLVHHVQPIDSIKDFVQMIWVLMKRQRELGE